MKKQSVQDQYGQSYIDPYGYLFAMSNSGEVKYHNIIKNLCAPLKKHFKINGFRNYSVSYAGEYYFISNRPHLSKEFIERGAFFHYRDVVWPKYDRILLPMKMLYKKIAGVDFWTEEYLIGRHEGDYSIGLCEYTEYGREQFWFTGYESDGLKDIYHNEMGSLEVFIQTFKEKAKPALDELKAMGYKVSDLSFLNSKENFTEAAIDADENIFKRPERRRNMSFLHEIGAFNDIVRDVSLTDKEKNILLLTSNGLTSKEIAAVMKISYRTVEYHLMNIKNKLNAKNKLELLSIFSIFKDAGLVYLLNKLKY